jgi:alpha-glucosidase
LFYNEAVVRKPKKWFEGAVVYQVYPRSFYDASGDGIGDLRGLIDKLDYLAGGEDSLGVDAIWLGPVYKSPMADFGYDVADYYSIDPVFGDMADFNELLAKTHERGVKLLMDLVVNHTSDQHPWFIDSRSGPKSQKRDWYIWHPGKDGGPPNDWLSVFGGSAWQYDQTSGEYYLHSFAIGQPDLNWENKQVRGAIKEMMRFWLDLGVDGFRADAVYWLSKDHRFRNDPPNNDEVDNKNSDYDRLTHLYSRKGPRLYEYLNDISSVFEHYPERFMVIEAVPEGGKEPIEYLKFYDRVNPQWVAPFNFEGIYLAWQAVVFKKFIDQFQAALKPDYLPVYVLGNHDRPRLASRIGRPASATAAMLLLCLPGMAFIYNGEEIGMTNVAIPPDEQLDPDRVEGIDRDEFRTPLQWSAHKNAGFSNVRPWLPVAKDYHKLNIERQLTDQDSLLRLYQKLIALRASHEPLRAGTYGPVAQTNSSVFCFTRKSGDASLLIALNFSAGAQTLDFGAQGGRAILSTYQDAHHTTIDQELRLRPHEGLIIATAHPA